MNLEIFSKKLSNTNSPNKNYTSNYRIQVHLFKGDLGGSNFCSQILENWDKLKDFWQFNLKILATDLGFFNSHKNYTQFIVLSQARTGSNFLLSLLDSHEQVVTYGELFRDLDSVGWDRPSSGRNPHSKPLILLRNKNPRKFLETEVYNRYPLNVSAVGFKIFYDHARAVYLKTVWEFLQSQRDIKIIHLKRRNLLQSLVSLKKALITKQWIAVNQKESKDKLPDTSITLTYEDCLQYFQKTHDYMLDHDTFFSQHPMIDIYYEDLCADNINQTRMIQDFLGLNYRPLKSYTLKQSSLPISESITNYFELKEQFQNTPWSVFFED
jgi:LPS sulfotransferase NodH